MTLIPDISIIIPCYNAADFIKQTLDSILIQRGVIFEIIIVNDGSIDNSEKIIGGYKIDAIKYFKQTNKGVSSARNLGLEKAEGKYIVFFDADDVMSESFLETRFLYLEKNSTISFVSGPVQKFNGIKNIEGYYRGTSENVFEEILLYNQEVVTCPSNFMFRKSFLNNNHLKFNERLMSTADRFFLLECVKFGSGRFNDSISKLLYRVSEKSMSNLLSEKLVLDNELFYNELLRCGIIPHNIENKALFLRNYILAASYLKIKNKTKFVKYLLLCLFTNPISTIKKLASASKK